jgi:uracil-DNA glycosylase
MRTIAFNKLVQETLSPEELEDKLLDVASCSQVKVHLDRGWWIGTFDGEVYFEDPIGKKVDVRKIPPRAFAEAVRVLPVLKLHGQIVMDRIKEEVDSQILKEKKWIVGESPGPLGDPNRPLFERSGLPSRSGDFLARLAGCSLQELHDRWTIRNVLKNFPGRDPSGRGDAFPAEEARQPGEEILRRAISCHAKVLVLGKRAAEALGLTDARYLEWYKKSQANPWHKDTPDTATIGILPHPSGINHWWNEPGRLVRAAKFMEEFLE